MTSGRTTPIALSITLLTLNAGILFAGNPIGLVPQLISPATRQGLPLVWRGPTIPYWPDRGSLGIIPNRSAKNLVSASFRVWDDQSSVIGFMERDGITEDINASNFMDYLERIDGISPIIFDNNGEILRALGFSKEVLGLAGPEFIDTNTGFITEAFAIISGDPFDGDQGDAAGELDPDYLEAIMIHQFGHYAGLGHSQVNGGAFQLQQEVAGFGIPPLSTIETMYPMILTTTQKSLETDDIVTLNWLYPGSPFLNNFATIAGVIREPDKIREAQGINVIARNMDSTIPLAAFKEAVSQISGVLYDPDISPSIGTRGEYELPGLPTLVPIRVEIEPLVQIQPLAGKESFTVNVTRDKDTFFREFYNGALEENSNPPDDPEQSTNLKLSAGERRTVDIILNEPLFLTGLSPASVPSHSDQIITIRGEGFQSQSRVNIGTDHFTKFVGTFNVTLDDSTQLSLILPPEVAVGKNQIKVVRPPGGRGNESVNFLEFEVTPVPMSITSVVPSQVRFNSNELVEIRGSNFFRQMFVLLSPTGAGPEVMEPADVLSSNRLTFRVTAAAAAAQYNLRVSRPPSGPDNETSSVPFEVLSNPLQISQILPEMVFEGSGSRVSLIGTGFTNNSIVSLVSVSTNFATQVIPSFFDSTNLSFTVPITLKPDRYNLTVSRPPGDAANLSNRVGLQVLAPPTTTTTTTTTTIPTTTTTSPGVTTTTSTASTTTTTLPGGVTTTSTFPPGSSTTTTTTTSTTLLNLPPFGLVESPRQNTTVQGIIPVVGWAVDNNGEVRVTLMIDGVPDGSAVTDLPRPDVAAVFPQFPNSDRAGFRIDLDTRTLSDRFHLISVLFVDRLGATSTSSDILIFVLNNP